MTNKAIIQAGWDDAPWLSEAAKQQMEADTPPHLIEARRNGRPSMGSGNVFPIAIESILCEPFKIPSFWKLMYGLDVGWNTTAAVWGALDPQTDTLYIYDEYVGKMQMPVVNAAAIRARGEWIPGVIDPASRGRSQSDGTQLLQSYKDLGLRVHLADNAVEAGITDLWNRMTSGTLKVFNSLQHLPKEFILYRRDLRGRIIKENDHCMDALRYVQNNLRRAKSKADLVSTHTYTGAAKYRV